eukprot:Opistho-2@54630
MASKSTILQKPFQSVQSSGWLGGTCSRRTIRTPLRRTLPTSLGNCRPRPRALRLRILCRRKCAANSNTTAPLRLLRGVPTRTPTVVTLMAVTLTAVTPTVVTLTAAPPKHNNLRALTHKRLKPNNLLALTHQRLKHNNLLALKPHKCSPMLIFPWQRKLSLAPTAATLTLTPAHKHSPILTATHMDTTKGMYTRTRSTRTQSPTRTRTRTLTERTTPTRMITCTHTRTESTSTRTQTHTLTGSLMPTATTTRTTRSGRRTSTNARLTTAKHIRELFPSRRAVLRAVWSFVRLSLRFDVFSIV